MTPKIDKCAVCLLSLFTDFECYSCLMDAAATDRSCLNNPAGVTNSNPIVKCPFKYCTIIRTEYLETPGQIFTFYRGCTSVEDEGVTEGGGFKVYTRLCTANRCNYWDGISSGPSGGSGGSGGSGDGVNGPGSNGSGGNLLPWDGIGHGGAGNQRGHLYVTVIAIGVVMKLCR